ncbi:MAG: hypothetical protein ACJ76B_03560 [Solirubrobacterales bacterium]
MAKGKDEHKMLFDLRGGRRGQVVKVVYALLAVLMGLSLFLVIGGFNLAELFNSTSSTGDAAKPYEEQAERIEVKLKKDPDNPDLLLSLTRAQVSAGNAQVTVEPNGTQSFPVDAVQDYQEANQTWSEYLKVTDEPNASLALLMSPTLIKLAELARSYTEADANLDAAVEAQRIVSEQRPSLNAFTTLAYYTYFTGDFAAAEKAEKEAKKLASGKPEVEAIEKQLGTIEKNARKYVAAKEKAEKEAKAAGGNGKPGAIEPGENPFGGGAGLSGP